MAADAANRLRYRQYTLFLRDSVEQLNMAIAPDRLNFFRTRIQRERNRFLLWEVLWLLLAVVFGLPALMLMVADGTLLPSPVQEWAKAFQSNLNGAEPAVVGVASVFMFVVATTIAMGPIILYGNALNDLERANRRLKALRRE